MAKSKVFRDGNHNMVPGVWAPGETVSVQVGSEPALIERMLVNSTAAWFMASAPVMVEWGACQFPLAAWDRLTVDMTRGDRSSGKIRVTALEPGGRQAPRGRGRPPKSESENSETPTDTVEATLWITELV